MTKAPILYSFRRCPYAMRARLAVAASGVGVELREVVLRDKPAAMVEASPKATVPVLVTPAGDVIDESFDIMLWALEQNDPQGWLSYWRADKAGTLALVGENDGPFKDCLDRYKYPQRFDEGMRGEAARDAGLVILKRWDERIGALGWIAGEARSLADMALRPFVRQFASVDREWFDAQDVGRVRAWLDEFLGSELFAAVMPKFAKWEEGTQGVRFL